MNRRILTLACLLASTAAFAAGASQTFRIVQSGDNAPEALVRVIRAKELGSGRYEVTVAMGPCRRKVAAQAKFLIESNERVAKDDLFFQVPISDEFALRRATPAESAMYEQCRWLS